ncbi:MAG: HAD-IC family P-type ATPase, partial [Eggerthellaceae bacterium]|nr:HAD-IC family P-type ATPase [Eggerthellaceae bacterium]
VAIFLTGSYQNLLFMVIVLANLVIGIFQEIRAKMMVDQLSVITSSRAHVIRNGQREDIHIDELVLDDIIMLGRGDQIPADCVVVEGKCSANESLVTGESDIIPKRPGSELLSGTFIVAGSCTARVTAVGADNYASHINNGAKVFKKVRSEIMDSLNAIVKYVSIALVPLGILLFGKEMLFSQYGDMTSAILHTSAALIGMIPQGLILLTSAVLAVSVFRLAQNRVLVQQIYCVETLARVDVVCLDKTGTITTGEMEVDEVIPLAGATYDDVLHALKALVAVQTEMGNETSRALVEYVQNLEEAPTSEQLISGEVRSIPFSSERKYSGVCYGSDAGNYALGAVEFVLRGHERLEEAQDLVKRLAGVRRAVVVARVEGFDERDAIIGEVEPLGLVFVKDQIRPSAKQTLKYFRDQRVRVNVISGDSAVTVSKVAKSAGVLGADKCIDMSTVTTQEELERAAAECRVFGRVSPEQKKQLVEALQKQGHTVAMTGDGVNDALALHASDCSVAMGSGSDAARSIAQVVLLDDDFSTMPNVVAEGRRSIFNLQRSAVLFLMKTLYSIAMAVLFVAVVAYDYPFTPVQLTIISFFTIGLPSFVLALEPCHDRNRGRFLRNVVTRAIPGAVAVMLVIIASIVVGSMMGASQAEYQTMCVLTSAAIGMNVVARQSQPFNTIRVVLFVVCLVGLLFCVFGTTRFLMLAELPFNLEMASLIIAVVVMVAFNLVYSWVIRYQKRYLDALEAEQIREREEEFARDAMPASA